MESKTKEPANMVEATKVLVDRLELAAKMDLVLRLEPGSAGHIAKVVKHLSQLADAEEAARQAKWELAKRFGEIAAVVAFWVIMALIFN